MSPSYFLFSVDLEDVRDMVPNGQSYKEAVPQNTLRYLDWLDGQKAKATFFVVGEAAAKYPDLIREVVRRGHEVACHSYHHIHITKLTPEAFEDDTAKCIELLTRLGAREVVGYRAPTFSMVGTSQWAYKILYKHGIRYSSSVLPRKNPLFGWPDFPGEGEFEGVYELPMNTADGLLQVPFGGGVYFRCLPMFMLKGMFGAQFKRDKPVLSYFHPYDIDHEQERFMHPHLNDNHALNSLMFINRKALLGRIETLQAKTGMQIVPYESYLRQHGRMGARA